MHIPVGHARSACTLTAPPDGVIHSFWVPELNGKKDVVPGRDEFLKFEADKPGTFLGQCAEYCGLSHADMRLRVIAQTDDDYDEWVARRSRSSTRTRPSSCRPSSATATRRTTSRLGLHSCHTFDRLDEPTTGPNLTHVGDRTTFAAGTYSLNLENLDEWVHNAPSMKPIGDLQEQRRMPNFSSGA